MLCLKAVIEDRSGRSSYGFDPFGLGATPSNLQRFQEAELVHCRWAMLGAAGPLAPELLGLGNWYDAPAGVRLAGPTRISWLCQLVDKGFGAKKGSS